MKKLFVLMLIFAVYGIQAQDDRKDNFKKWDADGDGSISDEEFSSTWDRGAYYDTWDEDGDGTLNEDEWEQGVDTYYSDVDGWNENRNRNFSSWDRNRDGSLDKDEFRQGSYRTWDTDGNNSINESEYNSYNTFSNRGGMRRR